jgi:CelD/BcsL family acetyltransferase involved in cellulose biosynthesis
MGSPILGRDPEGSMAALLEGLRLQRWDVMELGPMRRGGDMLELLLRQSSRLGLGPQISPAKDGPVVDLTGPWEAYYEGLSGKLRSQVKRGEARLDKEGPVRLEEHRGGPELESCLEEFYRVEASGWKGREGTSIASDPCTRRFYTQLAREAARRGWLRLYMLKVGQECVAADYCLAYGGTVYMVKVGYDERWAHCSPGQVMRKCVLERLFAGGRDEIYDMMPGGGDHRAYKLRWANQVQERVAVRLFHPRSVRGQLAAGASRLRAWLRERRGDGLCASANGSRVSP